MDKFEKILREKLQHHEANMPAGEWEKFSKRFEGIGPRPNPWKTYLAGGMAAATIGVGAYYLMPSTQEHKQQPAVVENTNNGTSTITLEDNHLPADKNSINTTDEAVTSNKTPLIVNEFPAVKENHKKAVNHITNNIEHKKQANHVETVIDKKQNNVVANNNENKVTEPHNNHQNNGNHQVTAQVQLVEPEIGGQLREVCQNTEVSFKASNARNDHDITWLLNGEEVSADAEFRVSFSKPGTQTLQLVYGSVQEGKRITKESEKRLITVLPAPVAEMDVNKVNDFSPEYLFKAPVAEGNDYLWNFGDGKVQTGNEITHVYRKKGEYNVSLTVTGSNGCKARKSEKVEIESDYNLLTPNAFSPNNDGHNDVFISEALKAMPDVRFRMIIFDKSGKKIFETTRLDNPWDGRNSTTGTMAPPDAYVWRVELSRPDGTKEEYMGSVTLLQN